MASSTSTTATSTPSSQQKSHPHSLAQKRILDKLVTKDDKGHLHKTLGVACLASYSYRYSQLGARDGNFGPHWGTLFFIVLHLSLNLSSFIFDIPTKRIKGGYRIWPEYRIHSLVFASRSLACMLLLWLEQVHQVHEPYYFINLLIVLGTCLAADYGSSLQKHNQSNTIRGLNYGPEARFTFSALQFHATSYCLVGARRYTVHLGFVTIVQLNAFLMTLQRKNIAGQWFLVSIYGFLLAAGLCIGFWDDMYAQRVLVSGTLGNVACILRMGPLGLNKYLLWTSLGMFLYVARTMDLIEVANNGTWKVALGVSLVGMVVLALWRRHHGLDYYKEKL